MSGRVFLLVTITILLLQQQQVEARPQRLCGARLWKTVQAICKTTARITDSELPVLSTRSIVADCCRNMCTHSQILSYCEDKENSWYEVDTKRMPFYAPFK